LCLLPTRIGCVELRLRGEQIRSALEQRSRLARPRRRGDRLGARRRDACGVKRLVPNQDRDAVPRNGGERLERRYRGARSRRFGLRALHVERRREPSALAGCDEAQRLVLRSRDRAHGFELPQCANEHEIVACDIGHHKQAHATRTVLDGERICLGRSRACPQAAGYVHLPRNTDASVPDVGIGEGLAFDGVVACVGVKARPSGTDAGKQPRAAHRRPGSRCAHARGSDLNVTVLVRGAANQVAQHRVAVTFPPGDLGLVLSSRSGRKLRGDLHGRLEHGRGTSSHRNRQQPGEHRLWECLPIHWAIRLETGFRRPLSLENRLRHWSLTRLNFDVLAAYPTGCSKSSMKGRRSVAVW
jgi:hypothetical protein